MSEYDFLELDKPTEMKTEAEVIAGLEAARKREAADRLAQQQREKEEAARKAREEEATRVAKESKAAEAARLAQEEADRTFALRLQAEEKAKGKGQGLGQVARNGPSVGVSKGTATSLKSQSGERPEGGPSSLPVGPSVSPSSGQQPLTGSVGTNPPSTFTPGLSGEREKATLHASSLYASAPLTGNPNQQKIQEAIQGIYGIFQNCVQRDSTSYQFINFIYEYIQEFINNVSTLSPVELSQDQESIKVLWNQGIIGNLIQLSMPQRTAVSLSPLSASSSLANSQVFTPEQVEALCSHLESIRSVFVDSTPAVGSRAGGEKKKAIRKTKRKSTSVKSKPSRKYKKRSVSTKK